MFFCFQSDLFHLCTSMEYSLPHAVMAFLQEEHSLHLPKSYFISSSTKSTKITLIYTRKKPESFKNSKKKCRSINSLMNNKISRHSGHYSPSSTDDYTQRPRSVQHGKFACGQSKLTRRICASTPGRGYSSEARTREMRLSPGTAKMPTDPVIRSSPSKDHMSISQLTSNTRGHPDSDWDDTFGVLSPRSLLSDRPPTPGREFNSSNSPRPPTPNASNYDNLMSNKKHGLIQTSRETTTRKTANQMLNTKTWIHPDPLFHA